jgi:hypothetical protein
MLKISVELYVERISKRELNIFNIIVNGWYKERNAKYWKSFLFAVFGKKAN